MTTHFVRAGLNAEAMAAAPRGRPGDVAGRSPKGLRRDLPTGVDGAHVVDDQWSMQEHGSQAVVCQAAINPVVALELVASGAWAGSGVLGSETMPPKPFLELLTEYGSPWGLREK